MTTTVKCSGCDTLIEIPDELIGDGQDWAGVGMAGGEPYYCDACERIAQAAVDQEPDPSSYCHYCGKMYEDFSDLGCEFCDTRLFIQDL